MPNAILAWSYPQLSPMQSLFSSASPVIARVEPLTTTRTVRGPFDYRLRPDQAEDVAVGALLRVPFGHRTALGVVLLWAVARQLPAAQPLLRGWTRIKWRLKALPAVSPAAQTRLEQRGDWAWRSSSFVL